MDDSLLEIHKHYAIGDEKKSDKDNSARELGLGVRIAASVSSKTAYERIS